MAKKHPLSVLLLDDNADAVELYKRQIERGGGFEVTIETNGRRARTLSEKQLFDVVVVDAKLDYKGVEFGGLRLADDLKPRYGANSILVISRFITASLMQEYEADHEFMAKPSGSEGETFAERLRRKIQQMRRRQYVFVAMPFAEESWPIYSERINPAVRRGGFQCVRVDEVAHTRGIHEKIFELVRNSKLVVFLADGANPNAYYEAGFADAMRKEVIIVARSLDELKFDVSNRNTITYGNRPSSLPRLLAERILGLRLAPPPGV